MDRTDKAPIVVVPQAVERMVRSEDDAISAILALEGMDLEPA